MKVSSKLILISLALGITPCAGAPVDPLQIGIAGGVVVPVSPTPALGGIVAKPQTFEVHVLITSIAVALKPGDTFDAALEVGTPSNSTKYGGVSGLHFTVGSELQPHDVVSIILIRKQIIGGSYLNYAFPDPLKNKYFEAVSASDQIACTPTNKLIFRVSGDSFDNLVYKTHTAATKGKLLLLQRQVYSATDWGGAKAMRYSCMFTKARREPQ